MKFTISSELKKVRSEIATAIENIDGIEADIKRANDALLMHNEVKEQLEAAKVKREEELAFAFIEQRQPDTGSLDKTIADLERRNPDGASVAIKVLSVKLESAKAGIVSLRTHEMETVSELTRDLMANSVTECEKARDAFIESAKKIQAIRQFAQRNQLECASGHQFYEAQKFHRDAYTVCPTAIIQSKFDADVSVMQESLEQQARGEQ